MSDTSSLTGWKPAQGSVARKSWPLAARWAWWLGHRPALAALVGLAVLVIVAAGPLAFAALVACAAVLLVVWWRRWPDTFHRWPGRIAADLGTHTGRRTVVTTLFVDGEEALEDIARFVGHARPATTAGYVKRLGRRPRAVAQRAAAILDGDDRADDNAPTRVRIHPGVGGSNAGSYRGARPDQAQPDGGP